ncbi:MAG: hypothetical protein WCJ04_06050 [Actinomycetes bacterium]
MNKMKKSIVAASVAVGLFAGGSAGAILSGSGISGAQETTTTVAEQPAPDAPDAPNADRPDPAARIGSVLAPLVEAGTINQAQADAVTQALIAAHKAEGPRGEQGGPGRGHRGPGVEAAATALGMTKDELRTAVQSGQTLAQVAAAKGVDVQVVIDAVKAELSTHLAEAVSSGKMTQAQADQKLAQATERITAMVNNGRPQRGGPQGEQGTQGEQGPQGPGGN